MFMVFIDTMLLGKVQVLCRLVFLVQELPV